MGSPKHQHFIPQSYLRKFAKKNAKDNSVVDTILMPDGKIMQLTTTNICVQNNLYTFPLNTPGDRFTMEKFYAVEVDAQFPAVYDMLVNPNITVVGKEDKKRILNTILSLYFRTPHFLNDRTEDLDKALDRLVEVSDDPEKNCRINLKDGTEMNFKVKDIETARTSIKLKYKQEFLIDHFADWQKFVEYKIACLIEVMTVPEEIPIITSDNPISILDLNGRLNLENIFHPNNVIELPINRKQYLFIHPNSVAKRDELRIGRNNRDKYYAAGVNLKTEQNCDTRLIAFPGDLQTHFNSQSELGKFNEQNIRIAGDQKRKAKLAIELLQTIREYGTISQPVADKVKAIRRTKLMDDDLTLQMLILTLARNGYLTM